MTSPNTPEAEAVIDDFLNACPSPTAQQVAEWSARHPAMASEFKEIFEASATMAGYGVDDDAGVAAPAEIASDERHADALFAQLIRPRADARTLHDLAREADTDVPALARAIDIERPILAHLFGGRIALPIGRGFVADLAKALRTDKNAVESAIGNAFAMPQLGHAKADGAPTIERRTWREAMEDSDASEERKARWLEGE